MDVSRNKNNKKDAGKCEITILTLKYVTDEN